MLSPDHSSVQGPSLPALPSGPIVHVISSAHWMGPFLALSILLSLQRYSR